MRSISELICHKSVGQGKEVRKLRDNEAAKGFTGPLIGSINLQAARYLGTLLGSFYYNFNDLFVPTMGLEQPT
jgi:hypothetical protein